MIKKILIAIVLLAMAGMAGAGIFARKAPGLLREAIEKSLNKKVQMGDIYYRFPSSFEISGFKVLENAPFEGETSFAVDSMRLKVSLTGLSKKALVIEKIDVDKASIVVRKIKNKWVHALSDTDAEGQGAPSPPSVESRVPSQTSGDKGLPLAINEFRLSNGSFRFVDYDVDAAGFVIALDTIEARVRDILLPLQNQTTSYDVSARILQGRERLPGDLRLSGWTRFSDLETDARLEARRVYLPYFRPYTGQVTQADIAEGGLSVKTVLKIQNKDLTANADFEIVGLIFRQYESDNELFGLNADEILAFLKDSSGRLKFQISVAWNLADRSVKSRDVIRRAIERSLKVTILGNVGNIFSHTIKKFGEKDEKIQLGEKKDKLEQALDKIRNYFDEKL